MDGEPELLDSGRPDTPGALSWSWRAHPRLVAAGLGAAAVAGIAWVGARALIGPDPQSLSVDQVLVLDLTSQPERPGSDDVGEVLTRDLRISISAPELAPGDEPWQVATLGLEGPGIVAPDAPPAPRTVPLEAGLTAYLLPSVAVDCAALPLPVDADDYGLRVVVGVGGRRAAAVLPLGTQAISWARLMERDCAISEAERTVHVVSATGSVDPVEPIVDLRFVVENTGSHRVEVDPQPVNADGGEPAVALAAGQRMELPLRVTVEPCPLQDPAWGAEDGGWPVVFEVAVPGLPPWSAGGVEPPGPSWLTPAPAVRQLMERLFTEACLGLPVVAIQAPPEGARFDPETRLLEGALVVDPPPDFTGRLSIGPAAPRETGLSYEALWPATGFTELGDTAPFVVPVRYRLGREQYQCDTAGVTVAVDLQLRVTAGSAERSARMQAWTMLPWPPDADVNTLLLDLGC